MILAVVRLSAVACLAFAFAVPAVAQDLAPRGVALVIGQSSYEDASGLRPLANPESDALALRELFRDLNFEVEAPVLDGDATDLRKALDDFADEAVGADVAVIYYSGHGIEAAGQSYLIPVDADMSTPATAGESLVPLGEVLSRLQQTAKVTILFFDACRTASFAPGQEVLLPGASAPIAVSPDGAALGDEGTRGAVLVRASDTPQGLGAVIGFAASPDQPALDGEGEHSPYAAALLKHFGAGEYGLLDVMTLVTQEVYVETGARQLPWTEASLRTFVTVGSVPAIDSDRELIRASRRALLMTIASSPVATRTVVESAARENNVPLDALYGMLSSQGVDSSASSEVAALVNEGAGRLQHLLSERPGEGYYDPEVQRLAALVDEAIAEGAIDVALRFAEQLVREADRFSELLDEARIRLSEDYSRAAFAFDLAGDLEAAAEAYRKAYDQVAGLDRERSYRYLLAQGLALRQLGRKHRDPEFYLRTIPIYREALGLLESDNSRLFSAYTDLAGALEGVWRNGNDDGAVEEAIEAYRTAYRLALDGYGNTFALTVQRRAVAFLTAVAVRSEDPSYFDRAAAMLREAVVGGGAAGPSRYTALRWTGTGFMSLAETSGRTSYEEEAIGYFQQIVAETAPHEDWRSVRVDALRWLGYAFYRAGLRDHDGELLQRSVAAFEDAVEIAAELDPNLGDTWRRLGNSLKTLGEWRGDIDLLNDAVDAYEAAIVSAPREDEPDTWARLQTDLGDTLLGIAEKTHDRAVLDRALAALDAALEVRTFEASPLDWAYTADELAWGLKLLGELTVSVDVLDEAARLMMDARDVYRNEDDPLTDYFDARLAAIADARDAIASGS